MSLQRNSKFWRKKVAPVKMLFIYFLMQRSETDSTDSISSESLAQPIRHTVPLCPPTHSPHIYMHGDFGMPCGRTLNVSVSCLARP